MSAQDMPWNTQFKHSFDRDFIHTEYPYLVNSEHLVEGNNAAKWGGDPEMGDRIVQWAWRQAGVQTLCTRQVT